MSKGAGAAAAVPPITWTAQRIAGAVLRVVAVLLLALGAAAATAAPATAAGSGSGDLVKVFVVPDPAQTGGAPATLSSIAAGTLGDPSRAGEVFTLNQGLTQADGSALTSPDQQLHPGWILRLPPDASGPGVQLARESGTAGAGQGGASPSAGAGSSTAARSASTGTARATRGTTTVLSLPPAAVLALLGAVLLALVTAAIVARRRLRRALAALGRAVAALGEPFARRRRTKARARIGRQFAADAASVRRAHGALGEFTAPGERPRPSVHALQLDPDGVTVWLPAAEALEVPWHSVDGTRWRRPESADDSLRPGDPAACLVRVGTDAEGEPVFVDLSRLDGVLSVTGDRAVARDVVRNLLAETARSRPDTPVTVLGTRSGALIPLPSGLRPVTGVVPDPNGRPTPVRGTVLGAAARQPVQGLVVLAEPPGEREAAELAALCGPGGAGWTGLVCGEAEGAHWRWHADARGGVELPILNTRLTVPA
ncbi:hypothetical protein GXW83_14710 [Streptacidiphilus sp. PB12-B1b]|uniref:hypothetical protein n=1 Tax=Streptacidiphilus sp. PB12-B1b TaxID=2705012 RepID=UPI0015F97908|nr:hypothetical protein [Streptacidiphilus sp. PB12-B1b]QMU76802.1 hypothetical protein GXW83_14710 [Streptacidiphilus sp. PB12-B1b]